ncbi:unnamed protein product [Sympodiomycopsis kandeliae]
MSGHKIPFPGPTAGHDGSKSPGMSIEIPKKASSTSYDDGHGRKDMSSLSSSQQHQHPSSQQQQQQQQTHHSHHSHHSLGPAAGRSFHHHPRQPGPSSESYFSGSLSSSAGGAPRTPGSIRGHSRNVSTASAVSTVPKSQPMASTTSMPGHATTSSASTVPHVGSSASHAGWMPTHPQSAWAGLGGQGVGGFNTSAYPGGGGLPSPSTLTDILLGLHSTLYGAKRSPEEVREMVARYYDADAVFESPLLSAKGREQIANQFIMAFALPGLDVTSELRDVICSDFEFDGTRAGIIDQTISVTILPSIFGRSTPTFGASGRSGFSPGGAGPSSAMPGSTPFPGFYTAHGGKSGDSGYPHHGSNQSVITPHPFADYRTPGASSFGHHPDGGGTQGHSPTTPFSISNLWGGGSSRPHTPGGFFSSGGASSSGIRPFTSSAGPHSGPGGPHRTSTPPSVNGDDEDDESHHGPVTAYATAEEAGGGQVSETSRLRMPLGAITPHWGSEGLGRSTVASFIWSIFHPRAVLKNLCTIHLRLMSRLEFNDAGHIVRHEDTWGVRETIEGTIPFASLIYALERRVVGYIASWAVGKGFSLSSALHPRAIKGPVQDTDVALFDRKEQYHDGVEAAHALLGHGRGNFHASSYEYPQTISRSRAPSPSRFSGWASSSASATPYVTGTRSRARSSAGSIYGGSRAASTDNLVGLNSQGPSSSSTYFASNNSTGFDRELPPDSSARYRSTLNKRVEGGRSNSAASAPSHESAGSSSNSHTTDEDYASGLAGRRSQAPDRDPSL